MERSIGSPPVGRSVPPLRRLMPALLALVLAVIGVGVGAASPASAAPVYEITGDWETGTPGTVAKGDVVTGIFRVNVNDDAPAPSNEPVDNVLLSVTLQHGQFRGLADVCLTTGEGLDPVSSVSDDGRTLTCNLGTVKQGTAVVVQTPVVVDGATGDQLSAVGTINGQDAPLDPIDIRNSFGMDMLWGTPSGHRQYMPGDALGFDLEWTLFQDRGSDQGPDTVTYDLSIPMGDGSPLELSRQNDNPPFDQACTPYVTSPAAGHPYSTVPTAVGHPQHAPFVGECTLTQLPGYNNFRLTLTGIDYSQTQVPTQDSAGNPMPVDRVAVASGAIWLQVRGLTQGTSANLTSSAPTYTSVTGQTATDDPSNNTSTKTVTPPGTWSHAWQRTTGGTSWDDSFRQPPGATVAAGTTDGRATEGVPAGTIISTCTVVDAAYVDYSNTIAYFYRPGGTWAIEPLPAGAYYEWYVGNDPTVTPGSGGYNPDQFTGCGATAGWTRTEPTDLTAVKAVRVTATAAQLDYRIIQLRTHYTIQADAPIGQDIWTWGSLYRDGVWTDLGRGVHPASGTVTATPGTRYNGTNGARDILRVIYAVPAIAKRADRAIVRPGVPATYTLTYSANGPGSMPPTVDDYTIVDTLPAGMTYVAGSATPAPVVTTNAQGRQVLTWTLDGVPTNVANTLTYQSVAGDSVTPGQTLTNTVTSSLRGETSRPASAQVTTSSSGSTEISKTADTPFIPNLTGEGDGEGAWTVTVRSFDPLPQAFTDTIDILPYRGDARGTDYEGDYSLVAVEPSPEANVFYTTADPATLSDDPAHESNGAAGNPVGNDVGWTPVFTPDATAVRVIGPRLDPSQTQAFKVRIATDGADGEDVFVNRAQGRAGHTELVMRTSAPMSVANYYSASLKKYVQDRDGEWRDANDVVDYPVFKYGDTVRYRIVVTNTGQGTLTGIEVTDDKQPDLGAFSVDELAPGDSESHEYEITLEESVSGSLVNTASATADTPADSQVPPTINSDPAGFEVANYTTVKSADPAPGTPVHPGEVVTYSVTLTQQGSAPAVASFSDDLADVLDDAVYNDDVAATAGDVRVEDGFIVWDGTIPVDGEVTVTYSVTIKDVAGLREEGGFELVNTVTSDGCAVVEGATVECGTEHPVGVFEYAKTSEPAPGSRVEVGDTVTYTVTVVQQGNGAVPGARLVDDMSGVLDDARYNGDAEASLGAVEVEGDELIWTGDLGVGQRAEITYSVTVQDAGDDTLLNVVTSPNGEGVCVEAADGNPGCSTEHDKVQQAGAGAGGGGFLPNTGGPALLLAGGGLGLLLVGGATMMVARRRREDLVQAA
ncbi:DUF7507 domain-containing protein [Nocardioides sp. CPCC 205120]|uniref:DUF7927 domain-containing protein n=1 Tax=Nocardioides sp. CPCC 205120 TaxID=3406462 RepID=UPI003B511DDC